MTTTNKPNTLFWVIGIIALLWNISGVFMYLSMAFMTDEMKDTLPKDQLAVLESTPSWAIAAFAIAVFAGLLGSILLLAKKKWAVPLFMLSLLGAMVQMGNLFFNVDAVGVYGMTQGLIMPVIVILACIFFYLYSKICKGKGWLK